MKEWLVADQKGGFAMGTSEGFRTRKYHGFYLGVPSRTETSYLADLEIEIAGKSVWPHCYSGRGGTVVAPDVGEIPKQFSHTPCPTWTWSFREGDLSFQVDALPTVGIRMAWSFKSSKKLPKRKLKFGELPSLGLSDATEPKEVELKVRPFFAMRRLHGMGGQVWNWEQDSQLSGQSEHKETRGRVISGEGREVQLLLDKNWEWSTDPIWHESFYYPEEEARGYDFKENLYSAGLWKIKLPTDSTQVKIVLGDVSAEKITDATFSDEAPSRNTPLLDFVLKHPAGVVAGYPWFGEWGRDTFIALPGIVAGWLRSGGSEQEVWAWTRELVQTWGEHIRHQGMLPNLIEKEGTHQWESADATLWWCHSLASLWMFSNGKYFFLGAVQQEFSGLLREAIQSIQDGKHLFLKPLENGLLEVTGGHSTWMDARINGHAVTPRTGILPEINALWFQARALDALWNGTPADGLTALAKEVLTHAREPERPNEIFLHSLPLSPSFFAGATNLGDSGVEPALQQDLSRIYQDFWTPLGLKTLKSDHPCFLGQCLGTQVQRDQAYHQGSPWGWLGGHFEMAKQRLGSEWINQQTQEGRVMESFPAHLLRALPIPGHIPELFDTDSPFNWRGTPAQAWSLACLEEAEARRRMRLDTKVKQIIARLVSPRGLTRAREQKNSKSRKKGPEAELTG